MDSYRYHQQSLPLELWGRLVEARKVAQGELVVPSPRGAQFILPHHWYLRALKRYCEELEIPVVGTHGLRHSTSEIYLHAGASRDDLRQLFAHSSLVVTDRYIRGKASNLERVSNVIQLFPKENAQFGSIADTKNIHAANSVEIKVSK